MLIASESGKLRNQIPRTLRYRKKHHGPSQRPRGHIVAAVASILTLGGGIGYAVQRLRAQRAERDSAAQDSFLAAVTMLASQLVHERVAAVHALAGIADSGGAEYRQRVADVLCGYPMWLSEN